MKELLNDLIEKFNAKAATDPTLQKELEGMERTIQITTDRASYHMTLREGRITALEDGDAEEPELNIVADAETLQGVLEGRIPTFKAMATGKLKVKASLEDALRLRKLLS